MHPFMPFITEEIWSKIKSDSEYSLIISNWPEISETNSLVIDNFEKIKELVSGIRKYRKEKNISFKENLTFFSKAKFEKKSSSVILKLSNSRLSSDFSKKSENSISFIIGSNEFHVNNLSNDVEDISKIEKDLNYNLGFLKSIQSKLNNKRFVENAPKNVLENELSKEKDTLAKIEILKSKLKK